VDDRILLVPPYWAPDPAVYNNWPMVRTAVVQLQSFLPVDHFRWPSLPGELSEGDPQDCVLEAFHRQLQSWHHVLCLLASELVLCAVSEKPVRSLIAAAFIPSPATAARSDDDVLAAALTAQNVISSKLSQVVPMLMQGAGETEVDRVIAELRRTSDYKFVGRLRDAVVSHPRLPERPIDIPALYLSPAVLVNPGEEPIFAIFRSYAPGARRDELVDWGRRLHDEAGGLELAGKVIPFIQDVIAQREAAGQT
jgi:hypothetical protein